MLIFWQNIAICNSKTFAKINHSSIFFVLSIKKSLCFDKDPLFGDNRPGDIPHSNANILKATRMLDYRPKFNFDKGIKKTIDFFLNL